MKIIETIQEKIEEKRHEKAMEIIKADKLVLTAYVLMYVGAVAIIIIAQMALTNFGVAWVDKKMEDREYDKEVKKRYRSEDD